MLIKKYCMGFTASVIFLISSIICRYESCHWGPEGYNKTGLVFVGFELTHFLFTFLFIIGIVGIGMIAHKHPRRRLHGKLLDLFLGLAIFTILFSILGLVGLLKDYLLVPYCVIGIFMASIKYPLSFNFKNIFNSRSKKSSLGMIFFIFSTLLLLIMKGFYPAGGHDYWEHYLPYQLHVSQTGSLSPNTWWYHFFVSKGLVLLTGALSITGGNALILPLIVSLLVILTASGLVMQNGKSFRSYFVGSIYLITLAYTPAPVGPYRSNGGWGDFGKAHEISALFIFALILILIQIQRSTESFSWTFAKAYIFATASSLVEMPATILLAASFFLYWLGVLIFRRFQLFKLNFAFFLGIMGGMIGVFILNLRVIGLGSDLLVGEPLIRGKYALFYNPIKSDSFRDTGSIFAMANSLKRHGGLETFKQNLVDAPKIIMDFFRLEYFGLIIGFVILVIAYSQFKRTDSSIEFEHRSQITSNSELRVLLALFLGATGFFLATLHDETDKISAYRGMASFLPAIILLIGLLLKNLEFKFTPLVESRIIFVTFSLFMVSVAAVWDSSAGLAAAKDSWKHAIGIDSTFTALKMQTGLSGRLPFGAVDSDVRNILGSKTRNFWVYTPNLWTYNGLAGDKILYSGPTTCWSENLLEITDSSQGYQSYVQSYSGPKNILIDFSQPIQQWDRILFNSRIFQEPSLSENWEIVSESGNSVLIRFKPHASGTAISPFYKSEIRKLGSGVEASGLEGLRNAYRSFRSKLKLSEFSPSGCPNN